jgi:hypothetical protein
MSNNNVFGLHDRDKTRRVTKTTIVNGEIVRADVQVPVNKSSTPEYLRDLLLGPVDAESDELQYILAQMRYLQDALVLSLLLNSMLLIGYVYTIKRNWDKAPKRHLTACG